MTTAIEKVGNVAIDYQAVLNTLKLNPKDPNVQALILVCQQYELDPVLKHMVLIQGAAYITHKGLWHMAHRSGLLDGEDILEQGETDKEWWAKVAIYRKDWQRPITMTGRYPKSSQNKQYGPEMAVTRAECLVLRRMFDVAVPVQEEINWPQADNDRGPGGGTSDGRKGDGSLSSSTQPPHVEQPALQAAPDLSNVDPATGVIDTNSKPSLVEAGQRATEQRHRYDPPQTSAAKSRQVMADLGETPRDVAMVAKADAVALMKKIGTLSGDALAAFNAGMNEAGLTVPTVPTKVTQADYDALVALLPAANEAVAS